MTDACEDLTCTGVTEALCGEFNTVTWRTEFNKTYNLLINSASSFKMNFDPMAKNDECEDATSVVLDGSYVRGSTKRATGHETTPMCDNLGNPDALSSEGRSIWYTVSGTGLDMTASTCTPFTNYDTRVMVYRGGCAGLSCMPLEARPCSVETQEVIGNETVTVVTPTGQLGMEVIWPSVSGQLYHIVVHGDSSLDSYGNVGFRVMDEQIEALLESGLMDSGYIDANGTFIFYPTANETMTNETIIMSNETLTNETMIEGNTTVDEGNITTADNQTTVEPPTTTEEQREVFVDMAEELTDHGFETVIGTVWHFEAETFNENLNPKEKSMISNWKFAAATRRRKTVTTTRVKLRNKHHNGYHLKHGYNIKHETPRHGYYIKPLT